MSLVPGVVSCRDRTGQALLCSACAFLFRSENAAGHGSKEVKGKTHTYYQVLIDARDCPHIVSNCSKSVGAQGLLACVSCPGTDSS